jgi:segregation and condensation protein A
MAAELEDYRVELDAYSGPLDLLLYLVRRHEIDLHDIPIAQLAEQYLKHLEVIKHMDVDLAGQFLVMAATLLEVKSAMLLPRPEVDQTAEGESVESLDPRFELVQQLLDYKRYKDAANALDERRVQWASRFPRTPGGQPSDNGGQAGEDAAPIEIDLEDVHVLDLCEAFARILESIGQELPHEVTYDDTPIALHAEDIVDRLQRDGAMTLQAIFVGRQSRSEMIGLFLATLELVRLKRVRVRQENPGAPIQLDLRPPREQGDQDVEAPDWRDPQTGEVQYEWPSEEAKERAERRAATRAARLAKREFEGGDVDIVDVDGPETTDP